MNSRPRILILSTAYLPLIGGSELAIRHITDRLRGYDFDMVTGRYTSSMPVMEQIGRVRVFRAGGRLSRLALLLPKNLMPVAMAFTAARLMRSHRYILVHAYQASQAGGAAWLLKLLHPRTPVVLTLQEGKDLDRQPPLVRFFRSLIFRAADRITAISTYLADYAHRHSRAPVDLVPNGVDVSAFAHNTPTSEPTIISVSRLVKKNGVENLIRAMPHVLASVPAARLVLVGDGPLRASLAALAADLRVSGTVEFAGTVPHDRLPDAFSRAMVFVRPSLSEGLGSAFLEAMAAGVAVVGPSLGGIKDFLTHEQTGLVCDPYDPADISRQIVRGLTDTALRSRLTANARALVRERYDWDAVARKMDAVYKEVASPKSKVQS